VNRFLFIWLLIGSGFLYAETSNNTLKKEKSFGVEINPFRLLVSNDEWQSFSGTMSYFDNDNGIEIAMPIFYSKEKNTYYYDTPYKESETVVNIDLHYRKYFSGSRTNGAYLGAFGRYTYLDGKVDYTTKYATVKKFGLGGEVGYRVKNIFNTSFYWGTSLSIGGYLGSDNNVFNTSGFALDIDDNKYIIDMELLKVGYEF